MAWHGALTLDYRLEGGRLRALDRHEGPLRVLKAAQPEGPLSCEHVLVHPPGGLAGGDSLNISIEQGPGTRVRLSTPGATRLYRSLGPWASQSLVARLGEGAFMEWLPLETIAHGGCRARSRLHWTLGPGAQVLGWDLCCLGLPASGDAFTSGDIEQHLEIEGLWLERARVQAEDARLRESPLGLGGHPVWATMWCAAGSAWGEVQRQALLDSARAVIDERTVQAAATSTEPRLVVVRALAPQIETVFQTFRAIRRQWLQVLGLGASSEPRIWAL